MPTEQSGEVADGERGFSEEVKLPNHSAQEFSKFVRKAIKSDRSRLLSLLEDNPWTGLEPRYSDAELRRIKEQVRRDAAAGLTEPMPVESVRALRVMFGDGDE